MTISSSQPPQLPPVATKMPSAQPAQMINPASILPQGAPHQGPKAVADPNVAALQRLLKVESDVRRAATISDLVFIAANEPRKLVNARQTFVVRVEGDGRVRVEGISSLAAVDRDAPAVVWVERILTRLSQEATLSKATTFRLPTYCDANDTYDNSTYPFPEFKWTPLLTRDGKVIAGLLLTRESPWIGNDEIITQRLADTFAHAWCALERTDRFRLTSILNWRVKTEIVVLAVLIMMLPVNMSILAPAEISAINPYVIAAPIDGVIDDILVTPNSVVKEKVPLVRFSDTATRNALVVAEREVQVADAKYRQVTQAAFADPDAKRELAVARADLAVKQAERDYARDTLAKTQISAPKGGIAVFGDKRELVGRPVTVGQRILEIADPNRVGVRIDVPVGDAISLEKGTRARLFLDSDPLNATDAVITYASHTAHAKENQVLSFRVDAELILQNNAPMPRLGLRGTAQIQGPRVPLFYYLFRKPITYVRQRFGL